ncbi:glycosyltransferase family 1 protein [Sulfurimonas lithotrophica]|uniref:Glycosyltransferase family 1 protein n=1 Tax=Sulfurimonas lithotrophica TaxID=2590022 RepID=A0A5P8NY56_9BACT|nr:glycosyltransferase [Sulfurimonas lithotrophica]QFR48349.1 glycosyltransferase family 1 protein [Sulfurimonas lithotrophica]
MKNNTIALFMPSKTSFYDGLFNSLKKAFEHHGYEVTGGCGFLSGIKLDLFINKYNPKVFFEMNRCKSEINNFPKNILHICWLVDLLGRKLENITGSEIVYFFSTEWMKDFKHSENCKIGWLPPASDPEEYYPIKDHKKIFNSVFLGHIPNPWSNDLLNRIVCEDSNKKIIFSDVLNQFENIWGSQDSIVNNDIYINEVIDWLRKNNFVSIDITDKTLRYDIGCRIIRKARRLFFLDWLLENIDIEPMGIFGGSNWKNWSKYKNMYQKELLTTKEMNNVYNKTKLLIHEGVGFHFRVFDAMLAGTPVIIRKSKQDNDFGGIATMFDENIEYISIDINKFHKFQFDDDILNDISDRAREKVLLNHTWFHRLSQVVKDINDVI